MIKVVDKLRKHRVGYFHRQKQISALPVVVAVA